MFSINPNNPTELTIVGPPVNSGGEFPISVAHSAQTGQLCVLNGGHVNGVSCFKVNPTRGLVPLPNTTRLLNINQTSPPIGPQHTGSQVLFSSTGDRLIAAVKGTNATADDLGYLAVWDVSKDGSLSQNYTKTSGGNELFSMSLIPGTDAILVSDPNSGFVIYDYSKNKNSANVITGHITGQTDTCWTIFSQRSGTFFLSDRLAPAVWELAIDEHLHGTVVHQYQQAAGSELLDINIARFQGKEYLYVLAAGLNSINVLAINDPGKSQLIQSYNFTTPANNDGIPTVFPHVLGLATYVMSSYA